MVLTPHDADHVGWDLPDEPGYPVHGGGYARVEIVERDGRRALRIVELLHTESRLTGWYLDGPGWKAVEAAVEAVEGDEIDRLLPQQDA